MATIRRDEDPGHELPSCTASAKTTPSERTATRVAPMPPASVPRSPFASTDRTLPLLAKYTVPPGPTATDDG
jgi:hypothetical protein